MSSLYGSDALGGVVQLTRRWPDAPRANASAGFGSYDTTKINAGGSMGTDTNGLTLNAGYFDSSAFSATNSDAGPFIFNPDDDGYRNTNLSANFVHRFAPDQELGLNAFYTQGRTHFDNGPTSDDVNDQTIGCTRPTAATA
jgi:vitamin B12 transporter